MEVEELQLETFSPFSRCSLGSSRLEGDVPLVGGSRGLNSSSPRWDCHPLTYFSLRRCIQPWLFRPLVPLFFTTPQGLRSISQPHLTS